jgi:hypothetical protein
MRNKALHLVLVTFGLASSLMWAAAIYGQEFVPDPAIQAQVRKIASATNDIGYAYIEELKNMANGDRGELTRQAIWFSAKSHSEREVWFGLILMGQLGVTNSDDILRAITPLLWTRDEDVKRQLREFVYDAAGPHPSKDGKATELDFNYFVSVLQSNKANPPEVLVCYMFSFSPTKALKVLSDIYVENPSQREKIMGADRALNDYLQLKRDAPADDRAKAKQAAQDALTFLSGRSEWPVRRYVESIKGNPKLHF